MDNTDSIKNSKVKKNSEIRTDTGFLIKVIQGAIIGLGGVLPGISGGVLCVIFGIYSDVMELLADPIHRWRTHIVRLFPVIIGGIAGFVGIAGLLSLLLEQYEIPSICLFVGLISGMFPSLWKEAGKEGRTAASYITTGVMVVIVSAILIITEIFAIKIVPGTGWYVFCGFCLALSVIAPGMSFSTLLMPLGLYEPFIDGISHINFAILIPAGIGAVATVILLSKAVDLLFKKKYNIAFHAIIGIVVAATIMIIPADDILSSPSHFIIDILCIAVGIVAAMLMDKFNSEHA